MSPRNPPTGLMRWFMRAPVYLYRWGLGGMMGARFILLHHVGRKSGLLREAVVEVMRHDSEADIFYIASGYGERSQWYKNLIHQPEITIQAGRRKLAVRAERLSLEAATAELVRYGQRYPRAAQNLGRVLGIPWDGSPEQAPNAAAVLPVFRLSPRA